MMSGESSITHQAGNPAEREHPFGGLGFDWAVVALSYWFLGGLFLDGWAHNHLGSNLETFFTPWHGVLYSGFFALAIFLVVALIRNRFKGYPWQKALRAGYGLSIFGVFIFLVGGVGDMIWHVLFGIEVNVEALYSPTHLLLAVGGALMTTGPLRSAWGRPNDVLGHSWAALLPMLLSLTILLAVLTFFTQIAHPIAHPFAAQSVSSVEVSSEIYSMRADGGSQTRLTNNLKIDDAHPSLSPDGTKIAFMSTRDGNREIYMMNVDGGGATRLTNNKVSDSYPSWSPDGKKIAFISRRDGNPEVYVMNSDGSGQTRLTTSGVYDWPVSWSPDGSRIAFTTVRDGKLQSYMVNVDGSGEAMLINSNGAQPSWSPDGKKIAFASNRDGNVEIYTMNIDGSGISRLTNQKGSDVQPSWSPDGRKIVFSSRRDGNAEIYVMNADGSSQVNLTNSPGTDDSDPSWSSDSSHIVSTSVGSRPSPFLGQALGVASILLQTTILMGVVLFAVRRWSLPVGSLTFILTLNAFLMGFLEDTHYLVIAAFSAGVAADLLMWRLKPSAARIGALRFFAFAVPVVYYGSYFLVLMLTNGIGWTVHVWMGAIVLAGIVGWLLSYVLATPEPVQRSSGNQ